MRRVTLTLPLKAARDSADNLLEAVQRVVLEPMTSNYYVMDMGREFLRPE